MREKRTTTKKKTNSMKTNRLILTLKIGRKKNFPAAIWNGIECKHGAHDVDWWRLAKEEIKQTMTQTHAHHKCVDGNYTIVIRCTVSSISCFFPSVFFLNLYPIQCSLIRNRITSDKNRFSAKMTQSQSVNKTYTYRSIPNSGLNARCLNINSNCRQYV